MPAREPENQHDEHLILKHSKKSSQRKKIIGHNSEALANEFNELVSKCKDFEVIGKINVKNRVPLEGTKVPSGGIEISCIYI